MRAGLRVVITLLGALGVACGRNSPTAVQSTPSKAVSCATGALTPGSMLNGDIDSSSACKRLDVLTAETTYTAAYSLTLRAGEGALVTMTPQSSASPSTLLGLYSPMDTLRAASQYNNGPTTPAKMLIASALAEQDTVRATTFDTLASDTGAFTISVQPCKVPVPPLAQSSDTITHKDTISTGDCQVDLSNFFLSPNSGPVFVHLYAVHFSQDNTIRVVTATAAAPIWLFLGPQDDAFGQLGNLQYTSAPGTLSGGDFGTGKGGRVLTVASADPTAYTLTIGTEQPIPGSSRRRDPSLKHVTSAM